MNDIICHVLVHYATRSKIKKIIANLEFFKSLSGMFQNH